MKHLTFYNNTANTENFKSFKYKAKLLQNRVAELAPNAAKEFLRKATIDVPLKYLSDFWKSLEMPLINCKVELKFRWIKYSVFSAEGTKNKINENDSDNKIIFYYQKHKIICSCGMNMKPKKKN